MAEITDILRQILAERHPTADMADQLAALVGVIRTPDLDYNRMPLSANVEDRRNENAPKFDLRPYSTSPLEGYRPPMSKTGGGSVGYAPYFWPER